MVACSSQLFSSLYPGALILTVLLKRQGRGVQWLNTCSFLRMLLLTQGGHLEEVRFDVELEQAQWSMGLEPDHRDSGACFPCMSRGKMIA